MPALDRRLVRRTRSVRPLLGVDAALGLGAAVALLLQASLLALIAARAFAGRPLRSLWFELCLLVCAFVCRGGCVWGMEMAGRRAAASVLSELRLALVRTRLRNQPTAVDGTSAAEIAAASVQGIDALEGYFARYLPQVVLAAIVPPAVLLWVAVVDVESALIMAVTLPLVPLFMVVIGRYTERRTRQRWQALRELTTHFLDVVRGLPTLRAFGRAQDHAGDLRRVDDLYRTATMQTLRVSFLSGSVLELAATIGVALIAVTAGVRLVNGDLPFHAGLTVLLLAPELYVPLRRLGAEYHASADGLAVASRIFELLDAPAAADRGGVRIAPNPIDAAVRLEGVSFSYPARPGVVLDRVELQLDPRQTIALVGESGAGKSTVALVLLGLLEPTAGRVTIGGVPFADCDMEAWRRSVSWVPQHPTIFRGSVADNIRLGEPSASRRSVRNAAAMAGADQFIRALPFGYETRIGDGARSLSAGERRRIALARAFVRDSPLLILDEPTADLDAESAEAVRDALDRLRGHHTVLVIAHRSDLLHHADRVVRIAGGSLERSLDWTAA